jgi:hypothetical protein
MSDWSDGFDLSGIFGDGGGGSNIDWASIIGQQPENGSFVGPDGTDPNGFTPQDYTDLINQSGEGLNPDGSYNFGGGGGGSSNPLQGLIRSLTGSNGGLSALLPFLAMGAGGLLSRNATNDATHQVQESLANANKQVTDILGGAGAMYKPYQDAGLQGLAGMQAFPKSNLAGNFNAIGSGKGLSLAQMVKK